MLESQIFKNLQEIINDLKEILELNTEIDENLYFETVGKYSKELKLLLKTYFKSDKKTQTLIRPFINYYRQLQHYLVFIIRYPSILQVPHHSEILQTLTFIENQEKLIKELYIDFSEVQRKLLTGEFMSVLEQLFELKLRKVKK